jgi:hypothetical protein
MMLEMKDWDERPNIREGVMMNVNIKYRSGAVDLSQPRHQRAIRERIELCRQDFPIGAEGVLSLDGVEHFFTYMAEGERVAVIIEPRHFAEALLNENGYSTIEPWSPVWRPPSGGQLANLDPRKLPSAVGRVGPRFRFLDRAGAARLSERG